MKAKCTNCNRTHDIGEKVGWKLGLAAGGVALGARAAKHPLAIAAFGLAGLALGHVLDTNLLPNCPSCQVALQLVNTVL